jgi:hypothetical protein
MKLALSKFDVICQSRQYYRRRLTMKVQTVWWVINLYDFEEVLCILPYLHLKRDRNPRKKYDSQITLFQCA